MENVRSLLHLVVGCACVVGLGQYDPAHHQYTMEHPLNPRISDTITPLPQKGEPVGIAVNGVLLYHNHTILHDTGFVWNRLEMIFDTCLGHIDGDHHRYHYHFTPYCLFESLGIWVPPNKLHWLTSSAYDFASAWPLRNDPSPIVGWALDGFPIFGPYDQYGDLMLGTWHENRTLDECNGKPLQDGAYEFGYFLTPDPPFTVACFRGRLLPQYWTDVVTTRQCEKSEKARGHTRYIIDTDTTSPVYASPCESDVATGGFKKVLQTEGLLGLSSALFNYDTNDDAMTNDDALPNDDANVDHGGCLSLFVSSVPHVQTQKAGQYDYGGIVNGRPYWVLNTGKGFIYHRGGRWFIATRFNGDNSAFKVVSNASLPTSGAVEGDWDCWLRNNWDHCRMLHVACSPTPGCPSQVPHAVIAEEATPADIVVCNLFSIEGGAAVTLPSPSNNYCMRSDSPIHVAKGTEAGEGAEGGGTEERGRGRGRGRRVIHAHGCPDHEYSRHSRWWQWDDSFTTVSDYLTYCKRVDLRVRGPQVQQAKQGSYYFLGIFGGFMAYTTADQRWFIYYYNDRWQVGGEYGGDMHGLHTSERHITPDRASNQSWECWDNTSNGWVVCEGLEFACVQEVYIEGCSELEWQGLPDEQDWRGGRYELMGSSGYQRYYKQHPVEGFETKGDDVDSAKRYGDNHLWFDHNSDRWMVGFEPNSNMGGIRSRDAGFHLVDVTSLSWEWWTGSGWQSSEDIKLVCKGQWEMANGRRQELPPGNGHVDATKDEL